MAQNITYKCPVCGAPISWSPVESCFYCEYCTGKFSKEEIKGINTQTLEENPENLQQAVELTEEESQFMTSDDGTEGSQLVKYKCSNCQAELITEKSTASTTCVYCGKPVVVSSQLVGNFKPDYVIPFEKTQKEAMNAFLEFMKKPLTPKQFKEQVTIDKVQGIYIPFWLFDGKAIGVGEFDSRKCLKETKIKINDKEEIKRKWELFKSYRKGILTFNNLPADASSKTDDEAMQSIEPFNFKKLEPFDAAYLSGYLAERYDEEASSQEEKINTRIQNSCHDKIIETVDFDRVYTESFKCQIDLDKPKYALLPTWLLYCTYKNKKYLFAMNGQTGKFIGNLPIDLGKAAGIWFVLFTILAIIFWIL